MDREEAITKVIENEIKLPLEQKSITKIIHKIYDDFENEDTRYGCPMSECKYFKDGQIIGECLSCCRNYYDMFEEKK